MLLRTPTCIYLFQQVFSFSSDVIPRSGIYGSYGSYIFIFLRTCHYFPQWTMATFCPHLCQHLSFVDVLKTAILTGVRWYLMVILICISLLISYSKHIFICLLAICISSLGKCLFRYSAHFKNRVVCFDIEFMSSFYILGINALFISSTNIFSHWVGCLLLIVSFDEFSNLTNLGPICL